MYREGQRVLITDPREIQDPLSNVIVALGARVDEICEKLGMIEAEAMRREVTAVRSLASEDEEREQYRRNQLTDSEVYHNYGGGI